MIARLHNRQGAAIDWRRVEALKPTVPPPEAIVAYGHRVFLRYDLHPSSVPPLVLTEIQRRIEEEDTVSYLEIIAAFPPSYWE